MTYAISKAHDIEETTLVMVASITHAVMEINQKTTERQFELSWYLKLLSKDKINCKARNRAGSANLNHRLHGLNGMRPIGL